MNNLKSQCRHEHWNQYKNELTGERYRVCLACSVRVELRKGRENKKGDLGFRSSHTANLI